MDKVNINLITVGDRYRKDLGDIDALANSINVLGLLQPIGIDSNYALIFGERRLRACQQLGLDTIGARIIHVDNLAAEHDENEIRKSFTISERVAIAKARQEQFAIEAKERQLRKPADSVPANSPEQNTGKESREQAAEEAGFKTTSYREASKVVEAGDADIVQLMDDEQVSVSFAAALVEEDEETRQEIVEKIQAGASGPDAKREVTHNHRAQGTGDNEWYTPLKYIEAARVVLGGIDTDPATSDFAQVSVKAHIPYTIDDDGLKQNWRGSVWLNPPYAQPHIEHFVLKLRDEYLSGRVTEAIMLTHNYTDTKWFHAASEEAAAILFTRGRIAFESPDGRKAAPTQGQAFFYYGKNVKKFADVFGQFGLVVTL